MVESALSVVGDSSAAEAIAPEVRAILASAVKNEASDVHLKAGIPPMFRINGLLRPLELPDLGAAELMRWLDELCQATGMASLPADRSEVDMALHLRDIGRFRCHFYRQQGSWAGLLRVVPEEIPSFEQLRLPPVVKPLVNLDRGIVLVSGATGMGKSTTVASMLSAMSASRSLHILTIEDPIEFLIPSVKSSVSQRGVGIDVLDFDSALEASFREDPDVLFIGELRSGHSVEVALQAGESGHLCVSTIHTADAVSTIARVGAMVPEDSRRNVLGRLAESLQAIISQRLVARSGRPGRILVSEVLVTTPSIRDAIRDPVKHKSIPSLIVRESSGSHCHTFDQELLTLVRGGMISQETARAAATSPSELLRALRLG